MASTRLLAFVKAFEGFRGEAYLDPANVWTIGYGETTGVVPGQITTEIAAARKLESRLDFFAGHVRSMVTVPMTAGQEDALTDFTYNLGLRALRYSTLLALVNAENYQAAACEFARWVYAGGRRLPGLVRRRNIEREWFLETFSETALNALNGNLAARS